MNNLSKTRKVHHCRLCGEKIEKGEFCKIWSGVEQGEGWWTSHAHPECYEYTIVNKWDSLDWECNPPGSIERPTKTIKPTE
jgi:hypothetical protein